MDIDAQKAHDFTLKRLFLGDTGLNWVVAVALLGFPSTADHVLGAETIAPPGVYRVIGAGFLLFAAWQTVIELRREMRPPALYFAAFMAEAPVVLLTVILAFMDLPFRPIWRALLWAGNIYMLLLGVWYIFVGRLVARRARDRAGRREQ
jgi:hypothetical protein